jgi:hypothetical protein
MIITIIGLSEQELVACNVLSQGCDGGWTESGLMYAAQKRGVLSEKMYPYAADHATPGNTWPCNTASIEAAGSIKDATTATQPAAPYTQVQQNSVSALMSAAAMQPIAITIEADQPIFYSYNGECSPFIYPYYIYVYICLPIYIHLSLRHCVLSERFH